ncbi:hypothetical protein PPGU19_011580 [Paraburkholderia sp. PGU19]|uniref:hypothetical protein n=1 Tax=Paraburkholderia sp. PGU19 TaxID=2735434 RepID=UPI0015DB5241|nr:hypothetical protein [Paraburkholderia sp. PGU19]BCF96589.1 hypothetical protein PPGU19_011580 [Paraburkholderia sp. PGU19]
MQTINDLRSHLFDTLKALNDKEKPLDIERAKVVADVGQVIINSAKVEVDFMRVAGGKGSGFIPVAVVESADAPAAAVSLPDADPAPSFPSASTNGIRSITRHVLKD